MTIRGFRRKRRASLPTAEQLLNLGQNLSQGLSMDALEPRPTQPKNSSEEWTTKRLIQFSQSLKNIWM
ncbi:MAG: hypothetical protein SNJ57_02700 [Cyanobacteriota bacterium]